MNNDPSLTPEGQMSARKRLAISALTALALAGTGGQIIANRINHTDRVELYNPFTWTATPIDHLVQDITPSSHPE